MLARVAHEMSWVWSDKEAVAVVDLANELQVKKSGQWMLEWKVLMCQQRASGAAKV